MRLIKSTDRIEMAPTNCHPLDGLAFHYLWELNGAHGGYERVRWCLHDVEKAFDIPRGTLTAKVHRMRLGNNDEILSAEQFVHARNLSDKIYIRISDGVRLAVKLSFMISAKASDRTICK